MREVISDTARPYADALAAQILEIAYTGIGAIKVRSFGSGPAAANGPSP